MKLGKTFYYVIKTKKEINKKSLDLLNAGNGRVVKTRSPWKKKKTEQPPTE